MTFFLKILLVLRVLIHTSRAIAFVFQLKLQHVHHAVTVVSYFFVCPVVSYSHSQYVLTTWKFIQCLPCTERRSM